MICNIGVYYPARHAFSTVAANDWQSAAQRAFNLRRGTGQVHCQSCSQHLETVENVVGDPTQGGRALFSRCFAFVCSACSQTYSPGTKFPCGHNPPCPVAPVSTDPSTLEEPSINLANRPGLDLTQGLPTKVGALVEDLQKQPDDVKWYVRLNQHQTIICSYS